MIRAIIAILKKHLDEAYEGYEEELEATFYSPWEILLRYPDYQQLRRLANELIGVMKGTDESKLIKIPDYRTMFKFMRSIYPDNVADEMVANSTRELRIWLGDTGQFGQQTTVRDARNTLRCQDYRLW